MDEHNKHSYGNGSTQPPKSHGGIIAVLLVLVILLGGISSALGILNIRLFSMLESQNSTDDDFHFDAAPQTGTFSTENYEPTIPQEVRDLLKTRLGIDGEEVSGFYQHYYRLPAGVLIARVQSDIQPTLLEGDILVSINGIRAKSPQEAAAVLETIPTDQPLTLVFFRTGREITAVLNPISQGE
jgi:hypothetical protein